MSAIEIVPERSWLRPGEAFRVQIRWRLPNPAERIAVRLVWTTEGRGERDVGIGADAQLPDPGPEGEARLTLRAPEGPYSFVGRLVSLHWFLEAVVAPGDVLARTPVVLAPTPEPIQLHRDVVGT